MDAFLSARAKSIKPSITLSISAKAKAMKAQGIDVLDFSVGEPDFDTPDIIKQAAYGAIEAGFTKYTASGGIQELKTAIIAIEVARASVGGGIAKRSGRVGLAVMGGQFMSLHMHGELIGILSDPFNQGFYSPGGQIADPISGSNFMDHLQRRVHTAPLKINAIQEIPLNEFFVVCLHEKTDNIAYKPSQKT